MKTRFSKLDVRYTDFYTSIGIYISKKLLFVSFIHLFHWKCDCLIVSTVKGAGLPIPQSLGLNIPSGLKVVRNSTIIQYKQKNYSVKRNKKIIPTLKRKHFNLSKMRKIEFVSLVKLHFLRY